VKGKPGKVAMTVRQAAEMLSVSVDTVRRLMDGGQLEFLAVRTRADRRPKRLPTEKGVADYLSQNTHPVQDRIPAARAVRVTKGAKRTWRLNPATGRFEVC
jgi:excisionase family DNA binding protein